MTRVHINLRVKDLDASVAFYSALFHASPTMRKDDYAQWLLDDPSLNLSVIPAGNAATGVDHLGIQAATDGELSEIEERIAVSKGPVLDEGDTVCCYAQSRKSWVDDPDGVRWEAFFTSARTEHMHEASDAGACC